MDHLASKGPDRPLGSWWRARREWILDFPSGGQKHDSKWTSVQLSSEQLVIKALKVDRQCVINRRHWRFHGFKVECCCCHAKLFSIQVFVWLCLPLLSLHINLAQHTQHLPHYVNVSHFLPSFFFLSPLCLSLLSSPRYADMLTPYMNSVPAVIAKSSAIYNPIIYAITHPKYR